MTPIPFTVVGGFLGAGKTTLINRLLREPGAERYAVLVNDFGELNLDAELIVSRRGQTLTLSNGCMCCSLANGFARALNQVLARVEMFDHVLIEASGVAEPARIIDIAALEPEFFPNGVVVLADALRIGEQLCNPQVGDVVSRQLCSATLVALNKTDLVDDSLLQTQLSTLTSLVAAERIVHCQNAELPLDVVMGVRDGVAVSDSNSAGQMSDTSQAESRFCRVSLEHKLPLNRAEFEAAVEMLPVSVIRGKGLLRFDHDPQHLYVWHRVGLDSVLAVHALTSYDESRVQLIGTEPMPDLAQHAFGALFNN